MKNDEDKDIGDHNYEWITVVNDKKPNETWRIYAMRAATYWGLAAEVGEEYDSSIKKGMKPRDAAIDALESFECHDECRQNIKIYLTKGEWVERPRLIKLPNDIIDFIEGDFTFTIYRKIGRKHTEIIIDDSEVFALVAVFSFISEKKVSAEIKRAAKESCRAAQRLMFPRNRILKVL